MTDHNETDVLVVGSGIAGLASALAAARGGADVTVATKATRPEGASSWWAQGGIAIARDDPEQFKADILAASSDTADPDAVDVLVENANEAVEDVLLETLDVEFDTNGGTEDDFDFGREAAHSSNRILHVDASTGKHIHIPFLNYLADHDDVTIRDGTAALELIRHEGRVHGAVLESDGDFEPTYAGAVVLATGGIGDLYPRTTNPTGSTGDGIAMAALAGADVTDMEYVQFHPTVCVASEARSASDRSGEAAEEGPFLVSEAVRGEGAVLRNGDGERFMPDYHEDAELAPRDVVARAVKTERDATGEVTLDVSPLDFAGEFPDLVEKCEDHGVDWTDGIPVAPAEHFLCGGIDVDDRGRTTLDRLYAVGECARTGVHGANRLASTSLLEGLVWGLRAGDDAAGREVEVIEAPELLERDPELPERFAEEKFHRLRRVMDEYVGLERDPDDLGRAMAVLRRLKGEVDAYTRTRTSRSLYELRAASVTSLLIARQAAENEESVGCHHLVEEASADGDQAPEPRADD
ncbi:L-aspartate oxidase [Halorientalis regularis]|jgi:L-aspartate oxidase|uniref:L-aspartate oxidase n=1 Tax=Halorientalis regularis TaxID=660518 RepID=A0A1G7HVF7_9EURY|nr:FAD-dependent oxidoreductase [Halorientalis regularis]SDF04531.1 L-aspartate oxidase [Halorientalis regularis]